jgi:peptide deformylase
VTVQDILLLGNPGLYEVSTHVNQEAVGQVREVVQDLHDTLMEFRRQHGVGRAIAAPQIGIPRRLIYMHITHQVVLINPLLSMKGDEMMEIWDDCMSFPHLLVKVRRYRRCEVTYRDLSWDEHTWSVEGDLSELIQHEYDHLEGILAVSRAVDGRSFCLKSQKQHILE